MKFIGNKELQHLARSARLQFAPAQEDDCIKKLNMVLEYSGALMEAVPYHAVLGPQESREYQEVILRRDRPVCGNADLILSGAPECEDRLFVVPVVIAQ